MNVQLLTVVSENLSWVFDGIGTEIVCTIVSLIVGAVGGGVVGYRIGVKNRIEQIQKGKENAKQQQIGSINIHNEKKQ